MWLMIRTMQSEEPLVDVANANSLRCFEILDTLDDGENNAVLLKFCTFENPNLSRQSVHFFRVFRRFSALRSLFCLMRDEFLIFGVRYVFLADGRFFAQKFRKNVCHVVCSHALLFSIFRPKFLCFFAQSLSLIHLINSHLVSFRSNF